MTERDDVLALADTDERFLFEEARKAYFKAGETSDPQHWMEAALLAQQHRNALTKLNEARRAAAPTASGDVREEMIRTIDSWTGQVLARGYASSWHYGELLAALSPLPAGNMDKPTSPLPSEQRPSTEAAQPFCWVLPGDDTASPSGWLDARVTRDGEFTKPLFAHPPADRDAVAEAIRAFFNSKSPTAIQKIFGNGPEHVYFAGFSITELADAIMLNRGGDHE